MYTVSDFIKLLRSSSPSLQVMVMGVMLVAMILFGLLFHSGLRVYTAPDRSKQWVTLGRVAGYPSNWEYNRSLLKFGVSFKNGEVVKHGSVYIPSSLYNAAGLKINDEVFLTVEGSAEGDKVRGLMTLDGHTLFDEALYKQVIIWNNERLWATTVMIALTSLGLCIIIVFIIVRNYFKAHSTGPIKRTEARKSRTVDGR